MVYSVVMCAQMRSCCRFDVEDYICKARKVMSLLDKATMGASCVYWEALKVDFALETLDKKHQYVSRTCLWSWRSER